MSEQEQRKGIVFCHTCNRIVGDSFPIWNHGHDFGNGEMAGKMLESGQLGFGYYVDTPEMRKTLAEKFPSRDEITIKL